MSIPEEDPRPNPSCPECHQSDQTDAATDVERRAFGKPYWCSRCRVAFTGSQIELQGWQAAKSAKAAERGQIASTNERGARAARPKET